MIKLVAIDLDGTLFDAQKNISDENMLAIKEARKNGCYIVIATGRPICGVLPTLKKLGLDTENDYVITYNGAKVLSVGKNELIFSTTITGKTVKELYFEARRLGVFIHAFRKNEELITWKHNPYTDVEVKINHIDAHEFDFEKIDDNEEFLKAMMVDSFDNITKAMEGLDKKYYDLYNVVRSSKIFLEFLNKSTDKGNAIIALANYLGIDIAQTMAIGDAGNDLSMIIDAGIGVAMDNAFKEIKEKADFITKSNEESGVAYAINKFVLNK